MTDVASEIYVVDAHHHFQDIETHRYPWLTDAHASPKLEGDLSPIRRNYMPRDYRADVGPFSVRKSVHIQNGWDPADPLGETRWLQEHSDEHGLPTGIVAYADLEDPEVATLLGKHAGCPAVRGIRQILNWHAEPLYRVASRPDIMDSAEFRRGFSCLSGLGLSFDLQIYSSQMRMARRLADDFPETGIVLNHFGMPVDRSEAGIREWRRAMDDLALAENLSVKLSGLGLGHPDWTAEDTVPLLRDVIRIFGMDRVMVGTNLPVDRLFASARTILQTLMDLAASYEEPDRHKLLHANAERITVSSGAVMVPLAEAPVRQGGACQPTLNFTSPRFHVKYYEGEDRCVSPHV